ncbi:MAG: Hsp20/alpha crystallin family protein [Bryobacter sp.]|nr:Hsp20/alpha crystallin family protein [Bryobacter sp.]
MSLTRYTPFDYSPFASMRFFDEAVSRMAEPQGNRPWAPAVDIVETENELIIKADLPAVKLENIDVRVEDGTLTLKGERSFEKTENEKGYHRIERSFGSFSRSFTLPDSLDPEKVKASFQDGVLTITLPKKEIAKPRQIKVEVAKS